jgi:hypothetical protein
VRRARSATLALVLALAVATSPALAQGDGPRVYPLAPTGLNIVSGTYMNMGSNFNFQQDILIVGADISSNVGALSYLHTFGIAGRFAQLWVTPIFGSVDGSGTAGFGGPEPETIDVSAVTGFADPYVAMRIGLVGAPALKLADFAKHKPGFQVYALAGANIPIGDYEQSRPLNLGTNRWAFRLGVPMVLPLLAPTRPLLLELIPSVYFYTDNDAPYGAEMRTQAPLFALESHASYNLTSRLWLGGDLRYQVGAETTTDGVKDDNALSHIGGNIDVGYQINRALSAFVGYGGVLAESDGAKGSMFRVRLNMVLPL